MDQQIPVGIVIIGRNEGTRLEEALKVLPQHPRIYVDSGSTDESCKIAMHAGFHVLELSPDKPFSAARGRNAGWRYLIKHYPHLQAVQFVDGDTLLDSNWINEGWAFLKTRPEVAAVYGQLSEKNPQGSLYNKLCELEWKGPSGEVNTLLGMTLIRVDVLQLIDGYRVQLSAGEDPELAIRLRAAGYLINRLQIPMGVHDAHQFFFSEWWKRAKRYGFSVGETYALHRNHPLSSSGYELFSICFWGLWIIITLLLIPWLGVYTLIPIAIWMMQLLRVAKSRHENFQDTGWESLSYALFCMIGKLPQMEGVLRFFWQAGAQPRKF